MRRIVPIVDLFSGPGGLAEGFAALRSPGGRRRFTIALSVEKDRAAHRTLVLRAFLRKFRTQFPPEYYEYLNGTVDDEPDWATLYPAKWSSACDETRCMELGTLEASTFLRQRIKGLRRHHGGRTVLLGGPPCQSYSIIGRSRNASNRKYNPDEDDRLLLYEQYAQVLHQLRPAVAVMENVKGLLSARKAKEPIFPEVTRSLRHAGRTNGYQLYALASQSGASSWDEGLTPYDFLVHAEQHGVPQSRHRLFIVCVRRDLAASLPEECLPRLTPSAETVSVRDVIGAMPKLRSRLSRFDSADSWQRAVRNACELVEANHPLMTPSEEKRFRSGLARARTTAKRFAPPWRDASGNVELPRHCPTELSDWIQDQCIERLPNNETRGHIADDLTRYLFASAFARAFRRTPKSFDFPMAFAPNHASWDTGNFDDRFRVQIANRPSTTITSHIAKDGHYFIHPDPGQCRSLTVREAARLQTFPDNYFFHGTRTQQYTQVGNAVPPYLAYQIAEALWKVLDHHDRVTLRRLRRRSTQFNGKRSPRGESCR